MKAHTPRNRAFAGIIVGGALLLLSCASEPQTFRTPEDAGAAFVGALKPYDAEQLDRVAGPGADEAIASGDPTADEQNIRTFVSDYEQSHRFEAGPDGTTTLTVGANDWPLPIPIIKVGDGYRFDLTKGRDEILTCCIGRNELDAIQVCRAIVDAQRDYRDMNHSSDGVYAAKLMSDPGTHDGLYWPTTESEPESPLGPLVADADAEGAASDTPSSEPCPYCGYVYRILTEQGPGAPGGARSYLVDGQLKDGFAVVAYPVDYGRSGIMTFIVNQNAIIYERNLGDTTPEIAGSMRAFDPDEGWEIVPPQ